MDARYLRAISTLILLALVLLLISPPGHAQQAQAVSVERAGFTTIMNGDAPQDGWHAYRWDAFPRVYILHFDTYLLQGQMLNRMAAYNEKVGLRGMVLSWRELETILRQRGYSMENVYGAHDYPTSDLARFFSALSSAGEPLNDAEGQLLDFLTAAGLLKWDGQRWVHTGADSVLSFATRYLGRELPSSRVLGQPARRFEAHGLYHEMRHGLYFTISSYADACYRYWYNVLSDDQRRAFRLILMLYDYDPQDEDLMINEWHAYLLTPSYEFIGVMAFTSKLRNIASGRENPRALTQQERDFLRGIGKQLADDIEQWMIDDFRQYLGSKYDVPTAATVQAFSYSDK